MQPYRTPNRPASNPRQGSDLKLPFFEHALTILARDGYGGFKQAPLCKSLGVTTGAFYHSFDGWQDFCVQFLDYWHEERTTRLIESAQDHTNPVERLEMLISAVSDLPHRAESAIRAWAAVDAKAAEIQDIVDSERYDVARQAFEHIVDDRALARRYARAGIALLVGFEQGPQDVEPDGLGWSLRLLLESARTHAAGEIRHDQ